MNGAQSGVQSGTHSPQYGMCSNVLYMLRLGREVPGSLPQRICLVMVSVVISVTGLYMSPTLLRILEKGQSWSSFLGRWGALCWYCCWQAVSRAIWNSRVLF